jgi:hypothetical protein
MLVKTTNTAKTQKEQQKTAKFEKKSLKRFFFEIS